MWRYGRFDEEWKKFVGGEMKNKLTESGRYEHCLFSNFTIFVLLNALSQ